MSQKHFQIKFFVICPIYQNGFGGFYSHQIFQDLTKKLVIKHSFKQFIIVYYTKNLKSENIEILCYTNGLDFVGIVYLIAGFIVFQKIFNQCVRSKNSKFIVVNTPGGSQKRGLYFGIPQQTLKVLLSSGSYRSFLLSYGSILPTAFVKELQKLHKSYYCCACKGIWRLLDISSM